MGQKQCKINKATQTRQIRTVTELDAAMNFMGNVNGDGSVDISDVILVLRIALGLETSKPCADINDDGIVDISDVILTLRMALGLDALKQCI